MNGPLLHALAVAIDYHDVACVETLRTGAKMVGELPLSGNGIPIEPPEHFTLAELEEARIDTGCETLEKLREDMHSSKLLRACEDDASLGRMTDPQVLGFDEIGRKHLSPRFAVEQGGARAFPASLCGRFSV